MVAHNLASWDHVESILRHERINEGRGDRLLSLVARLRAAFLFGTQNGARVRSFRNAAVRLFKTVDDLKFGRGRGQFRVHDARHETISALSQSRQFNDAQVKKFTGIQSDRTLARYRHLDNMDVALLAADVLDERAAQGAELALKPFMRKAGP